MVDPFSAVATAYSSISSVLTRAGEQEAERRLRQLEREHRKILKTYNEAIEKNDEAIMKNSELWKRNEILLEKVEDLLRKNQPAIKAFTPETLKYREVFSEMNELRELGAQLSGSVTNAGQQFRAHVAGSFDDRKAGE